MLGPYNTSDYPITIVVIPLIYIDVPMQCPYCYYCATQKPTIVIIVPYNIIVMQALIVLGPLRLLYIERRYFHLYHPRIVHLCNVKEVAPSKRLNSKALIYLFYLFLSWFHNIWYQSFGFQGFAAPNRPSWHFPYNLFSATFQKLKKKPI